MTARILKPNVTEITDRPKKVRYNRDNKQGKGLRNMTYRELQKAIKQAKEQGFVVKVKLNAKKEVLQAEYDRLKNFSSFDRSCRGLFHDFCRLSLRC